MTPLRTRKNDPHTINAGRLIAAASITLAKVAGELLETDPNEWYKIWLMYVDQITTQAELLKIIWEQNHKDLEQLAVIVPKEYTPMTLRVDAPLADVFKSILESTDENTVENGGTDSLSDFPF